MNATCRLVDPKESFGLQSQQFSPFLDLFAQSMYLGCVGFRNCDSGAMYVLRADGTTVAQGVILSKRTTAVLDQYENLVAYICAVPHEIRMFGNVFLWYASANFFNMFYPLCNCVCNETHRTKRVIVDPLGCYVATCPSVALLKYLWYILLFRGYVLLKGSIQYPILILVGNGHTRTTAQLSST